MPPATITITINSDALTALRDANGRGISGVDEVGFDQFAVELEPATYERLMRHRIGDEPISETIVRTCVIAQSTKGGA